MQQWIVFGFGHYTGDVFDIINSNKGRIKAVVGNIEYKNEEMIGIKRRIDSLGYHVPLLNITSFNPEAEEKYSYGVIDARKKLIPVVKEKKNIKFSNIIHNTAYISSGVSYGEGIVIGPNSVLASNCSLGDFCCINRCSSIGHDTELGEFCTVAPGVNIAGMVEIGAGTTVGIGATISDGIRIGANSIVGAGSVVLEDVPENVVVVGTPARILRKNDCF